jgi:hypothetical protein
MCNDNEKIFCCTKLYRTIESFNHETYETTSTQLIVPVLCKSVCPDECEASVFDPAKQSQYVTNIVSSCEECFANNGCAINYAIFFNKTTCSLEEIEVASLVDAENQVTETKILIEFIPCLSAPLSKADPTEFSKLLKQQLSNYEECHKPCCYLLENNTAGCVKLPVDDCDIEVLNKKLNTNARIINVMIVGNFGQSCDDVNCFDLPKNANLNINLGTQFGACCINNNCINISDVDADSVNLYVDNVLNINNTNLKDLAFETGIISAKDLCTALQGIFMGYNTRCNPNICVKTRIITT